MARVRVVSADFPDTAFLPKRWKHLVPERVTANMGQLGELRKSFGTNTIRRNSVLYGNAVLEHCAEHDALGAIVDAAAARALERDRDGHHQLRLVERGG